MTAMAGAIQETAGAIRALIADDQPDVLAALSLLLKAEGFVTEGVTSPAGVLEAISERTFDVLLMDLNYARDTTSGQEGMDLLARVRAWDPTLPVVVMTAWGTVDLAVEAMRRGVGDFVQKPWENRHLLEVLRSQVSAGQLLRREQALNGTISILKDELAEAGEIEWMLQRAASRLSTALATGVSVLLRNDESSFEVEANAGVDPPDAGRIERSLHAIPSHRSSSSQGAPWRLEEALLFPVNIRGEIAALLWVDQSGEQIERATDIEFLREAAELIARGLNQLRLSGQDREALEALEIQKRLLPKQIPQIEGYQVSGAWRPARRVSGDYFDVLKFGPAAAALCIGDVSGKGMPAALLMSNLQAVVTAFASQIVSPREMCSRVNRIICRNTAPDRFITFFYALLDARAARLVYTNAGHNAPFCVRRNGSHTRLESGGIVFGADPNWKYEQGAVDLEAGDRLLLFTDGVSEAVDQNGEEFGEERLLQIVLDNRSLSAAELERVIMKAVSSFTRGHLQDDATLIVLSADE